MKMDSYELGKYLKEYKPQHRDAILGQIANGQFIADALETDYGRVVLDKVAMTLVEALHDLSALCLGDFEENKGKIQREAIRFRMAHELLMELGSAIHNANEHLERMGK